MKKIQLNLNDLKVESFETTEAGEVFGYSSCPTCGQATCYTCAGQATCDSTCNTCPATDCTCPIRQCSIGSSGGYPCP